MPPAVGERLAGPLRCYRVDPTITLAGLARPSGAGHGGRPGPRGAISPVPTEPDFPAGIPDQTKPFPDAWLAAPSEANSL
jgi:hypothetical protein